GGSPRRSRGVGAVRHGSPLRPRPRERGGGRSISGRPHACGEARHGSSSLMQNWVSLAATLRVGGAMIYPLLVLAVVAAVVALEKGFVFASRTHLPASLLAVAETYGFDWDDLEREVSSLGPRNYFGRFFRLIIENQ